MHLMLMESPQPISKKINSAWKIAIIRSIWHADCTDALAMDAKETLLKVGLKEKNILEFTAPGSFEIPLLVQRIIKKKKVNGVIALGVIVQGETYHARLVADNAARGIMDVQLATGVPIVFEILYVNRIEDARGRSIGKNAKGGLAARTMLNMLAKMGELR